MNSLSLSRLLTPPFCLHCCCGWPQQSRSWCCHGAGLALLSRARMGHPREPQPNEPVLVGWVQGWELGTGPLLEPILLSAMSNSWEHSCWMTFPKALRKLKKRRFFPI